MLKLQRKSLEAKCSRSNSSQAYPVRRDDSNPLEELLGCGIECASNSTNSDVEEADIHEALTPSIEIIKYLKSKTAHDADTLDWWCNNAEQLPLLKQMALKYLCIPATSAASVRSFSAVNLRSRLASGHLESLTVLHCNQLALQ